MSEIVVVVTKNVTVKNASVSLEWYSQSADVTIKATIKSAIDRSGHTDMFYFSIFFFYNLLSVVLSKSTNVLLNKIGSLLVFFFFFLIGIHPMQG